MSIREFPQSSNEQEHRDWIADATIEELDEYIRHYSSTPTFYRMAVAQREKLYFELKNKIEPSQSPQGKITLKWLWENVSWNHWVAFIILLFTVFSLGIAFSHTKLYKLLIERATAISTQNKTIEKTIE